MVDDPVVENMADSWGSDGLVIDVTHQMSPQARLLLYYVRPDGETVADSVDFKVKSCFSNPVSTINAFYIYIYIHCIITICLELISEIILINIYGLYYEIVLYKLYMYDICRQICVIFE
jgi:hypothetical protein